MGAEIFMTGGKGSTAKAAFSACVEEAQYDYGHAGYTGTIAEKSEFVMVTVPDGRDPEEYANDLLDSDDDRVNDKWGPAVGVKVSEGSYLFFGWASS